MNKRKRVAAMKHRIKARKIEAKRKLERAPQLAEWQKPEEKEKPRPARRRTKAAEEERS